MALNHRPPARSRPRRLDGSQEAHLVALVCGDPPAGRDRWTLRLLADRLVELEIAATVSYQTVRRTLKKLHSSPGGRSAGACPPGGSGDFVAAMEDVLSAYEQPYDPRRPLICMDEASKVL